MDKKQHMIWIPLIGFDREQPDCGVDEYLENIGFTPKGVSVFLFHSDIINQHEGMDKEFVLHPDNCSYYGAPRNEFRERQDWTNYDLRNLGNSLSAKNIEAYLGVMGVYLENTRHYEWESDHPELLSIGVNGKMNLNVLKRFKDGTYYEDFFANKIVKCLTDYNFAGLHVSDFFCPPEHSIVNGDFSADMIDQFITQSGVKLPESITSRLGFDEQSDIEERQKYIWDSLRREWIDFYVWRWKKFWTKICDALHAIGKKVMINHAWCSDPFEAHYRYGIDYKAFYEAGVDNLIAETVPTGSELLDKTPYKFQQYMTTAQLMSAFNPDNSLYSLLGVKDCTEEWDAIHHVPMRLEKDMYVLANMFRKHNGEYQTSNDGYMITLGDGITKSEWAWLNERADLAYGAKPVDILVPTVVWSDNAHYALLDEYIKTRRPSLHKQLYETQKRDGSTGAIARIEELNSVSGAIFVPNIDLYTADEQKAVFAYNKGPVFCTAPTASVKTFDKEFDLCVNDELALYQMSIMAFGLSGDKEAIIKTIASFFEDGEAVCECCDEPKEWIDPPFFLDAMPFRECSDAFYKSLAYLLNNANGSLFSCNANILPVLLENGSYRIYVINHINNYQRIEIMCKKALDSVECAGKYPVMPPKFVVPPKPGETKFDGAKAESMKIGLKSDDIPFGFVAKVPPLGIGVFDVKLR